MYFCIPQNLLNLKLFRKRDFITVGFILIFSAAAVYMFYVILKPIEVLPIYQPAEVNEKLVDSSIIHVAKYHKISDFKLKNQNGSIDRSVDRSIDRRLIRARAEAEVVWVRMRSTKSQ